MSGKNEQSYRINSVRNFVKKHMPCLFSKSKDMERVSKLVVSTGAGAEQTGFAAPIDSNYDDHDGEGYVYVKGNVKDSHGNVDVEWSRRFIRAHPDRGVTVFVSEQSEHPIAVCPLSLATLCLDDAEEPEVFSIETKQHKHVSSHNSTDPEVIVTITIRTESQAEKQRWVEFVRGMVDNAIQASLRGTVLDGVVNAGALEVWLNENAVDTSTWGIDKAKTVKSLWAEVLAGDTILIMDQIPVRMLRVAKVLVRLPGNTHVLVEESQTLPDGRVRMRQKPLAEKLRWDEDVRAGAVRGICEELAERVLGREDDIVLEGDVTTAVEELMSPSFPGLLTRYTFYTVAARVACLPSTDFVTMEHKPGSKPMEHLWRWYAPQDVPEAVMAAESKVAASGAGGSVSGATAFTSDDSGSSGTGNMNKGDGSGAGAVLVAGSTSSGSHDNDMGPELKRQKLAWSSGAAAGGVQEEEEQSANGKYANGGGDKLEEEDVSVDEVRPADLPPNGMY